MRAGKRHTPECGEPFPRFKEQHSSLRQERIRMTDKETQAPMDEPCGRLILRTLAMPENTNPQGDMFGGWILGQMDLGGAILARELARGRVVTVAIDKMSFIAPVNVGDIVCCYGRCVHVGHTSLKIHLEIWVKKLEDANAVRRKVTEAGFTYVAIDDDGKKRLLPESLRNGWDGTAERAAGPGIC
jgi:acyl-CoA thioesterase YciA